ncbi:hypothetical protein SteCoe_29484 [Stentor coeruleus]|uniref:BEACH domain-containing protein n=1 Tax=Stentor coeruleus TaxID=5963 RepID=A0A1R2B5Y0_9CILI|nr:hypothetical protein SteCoe_29484 [Stentor coeruleus]
MELFLTQYFSFPSKNIIEVSDLNAALDRAIESNLKEDLENFCHSYIEYIKEFNTQLKISNPSCEKILAITVDKLNLPVKKFSFPSDILLTIYTFYQNSQRQESPFFLLLILQFFKQFDDFIFQAFFPIVESLAGIILRQQKEVFFQEKNISEFFRILLNIKDLNTSDPIQPNVKECKLFYLFLETLIKSSKSEAHFLSKILKKEAYRPFLDKILPNLIDSLILYYETSQSKPPALYPLLLDLSSYPSNQPKVIKSRYKILQAFSLKNLNYHHIPKITNIILHHFPTIHDQFWPSYKSILSKTLKTKISSSNIINLIDNIHNSQSKSRIKLLETIKNSLNPESPIENIIKKYWVFNVESSYILKQKDPIFICKNELSIVLWVKIKKMCNECVVLEIADGIQAKFIVKLLNKNVMVEGIGNKFIFQAGTKEKLVGEIWNFIGIRISFKKRARINIRINKKDEDCEIQGKTIVEGNFNNLSLGSSIDQSMKFAGKIAGCIIFKNSLSESDIEYLHSTPYISKFIIPCNLETNILKQIKQNIVFMIYPEDKTPYLPSENSTNTVLTSQYIPCIGNSLYNALITVNSIESLSTFEFRQEDLYSYLEICTILFSLPNASCLLTKHFTEKFTHHINTFKYIIDINKYYIKFINAICIQEIQKKILYYFCMQNHKLVNGNNGDIEDFDTLVKLFKKYHNLNSSNVLILANILKPLADTQIAHVLKHLIDDLLSKTTVVSIIIILLKAENFTMIEGILELIENSSFEGQCDSFLTVFLMILKYPLNNYTYTSALKIIYAELSCMMESHNKKNTDTAMEALKFIKERFTSFNALMSCLEYFGIKSQQYNSIVKREFFDIVLCKTRYLQDLDGFNKLISFLSENTEKLNSYVLRRDIFPQWLIDLYKISDNFAGKLAMFIFAHGNIALFSEKLIAFFYKIKDSPSSFDLYCDAFMQFLDNEQLEDVEFFVEFMRVLEFWDLSQVKLQRLSVVLAKMTNLGIENGTFNIMPSITNDPVYCPSRHGLRLILKFLIKLGQFQSLACVNCMRVILSSNNYFKSLATFAQEERKSSENTLSIYLFGVLCEFVYKKDRPFHEFFDVFVKNTDIFTKLMNFFSTIRNESIQYCANMIMSNNLRSTASVYLDKKSQEFFALSLEKAHFVLLQAKDSPLIEAIFSVDWIIHIHYVIVVLVVLPFKNIEIPKPKVKFLEQDNWTGNFNNKFEELLNAVTTESFEEEQRFVLNYLSTQARYYSKLRVYRKDESKRFIGGKYYVRNKSDKIFRWSLLKFTDKDFGFDLNASRLFHESILRSEAINEFDSRLYQSIYLLPSLTSHIPQEIASNNNFIKLDCEQIKITGSYFGSIKISKYYIEFECKGKLKNQQKYLGSALEFTKKRKKCLYTWSNNEILEILSRRFIHKNSAFEVFLKNGKSCFFNVFTDEAQSKAFSLLKQWKNVLIYDEIPLHLISEYTNNWSIGKISTLEYLLALNKYAGRSFNDISQYPVFPWVIKDFSSSEINVDNPKIYRDFAYSIGSQDANKRAQLKQKCSMLDEDFGIYHYGQHYSNPGIVLYYFIRLEPYTTQSKILQEGHFDNADRTFFSMQIAWESTQIGSGDTKELIPELFYFPYIFENINTISIGINQRFNRDSAKFILPEWAENSWDFIRKHRKCLESTYTNNNIHMWIDLIFGYKQMGDQAESCYNLFHPITYSTFYTKYIESYDIKEYPCVIDQAYHFGQTPQQIFKKPHPKRKFLNADTVFDIWKKKGKVEIRVLNYQKNANIINAVTGKNFVVIMICVGEELKLVKYDNFYKSVGKGKEVGVKGVKVSDFKKILMGLWNEFIVTAGYLDKTVRMHSFEGEMVYVLYYHPNPVQAIYVEKFLYTADISIVSWSKETDIYKKYFGHRKYIMNLCCSELFNIMVSSDIENKILIHAIDTCEILHSLSFPVMNIFISKLYFIVFIDVLEIKIYSFEGNLLWNILVDNPQNCLLNDFGDYLAFSKNHELVVCDLLESSFCVHPVENLRKFVLGDMDKIIVCFTQMLKI